MLRAEILVLPVLERLDSGCGEKTAWRAALDSIDLVFPVMFFAKGVEAKNFVLNVGHLGRREPVVQPAISKGQLDLKVVGCVLGEGKREGEGRDEPRT
jgi:hypothetical protein